MKALPNVVNFESRIYECLNKNDHPVHDEELKLYVFGSLILYGGNMAAVPSYNLVQASAALKYRVDNMTGTQLPCMIPCRRTL